MEGEEGDGWENAWLGKPDFKKEMIGANFVLPSPVTQI